jgi:hypothetical protein
MRKAPGLSREPEKSGLPGGVEPAKLDLPELDFRIQAQLLLLEAEDVFVEGDAGCRVFTSKKVENPGLDLGMFGPEPVDFLL